MSDVSGARDCSTRLKSTSIKGNHRVANAYLRNICVALSQWGFNIIVHPDVVTSRQILLKTTLLKVFVEWPSNLRVELNATVRVGRIQVRLGLDFLLHWLLDAGETKTCVADREGRLVLGDHRRRQH